VRAAENKDRCGGAYADTSFRNRTSLCGLADKLSKLKSDGAPLVSIEDQKKTKDKLHKMLVRRAPRALRDAWRSLTLRSRPVHPRSAEGVEAPQRRGTSSLLGHSAVGRSAQRGCVQCRELVEQCLGEESEKTEKEFMVSEAGLRAVAPRRVTASRRTWAPSWTRQWASTTRRWRPMCSSWTRPSDERRRTVAEHSVSRPCACV
jgi:hypothetical protein